MVRILVLVAGIAAFALGYVRNETQIMGPFSGLEVLLASLVIAAALTALKAAWEEFPGWTFTGVTAALLIGVSVLFGPQIAQYTAPASVASNDAPPPIVGALSASSAEGAQATGESGGSFWGTLFGILFWGFILYLIFGRSGRTTSEPSKPPANGSRLAGYR